MLMHQPTQPTKQKKKSVRREKHLISTLLAFNDIEKKNLKITLDDSLSI